MPHSRIIGIDFGTHKTLVARWDEENRRPTLIRLRPASGDDMPSAVHVDAGGTLTFGEEAEQLGSRDAEGYQRAFKRDLGIHAAPYLLHTHEYSARDLSREYLRWIKALVEEESLHGPVDHAVITVPASWLPAARTELQQAAADAGFASVELLDEPVAAGMAFLKSRRDLWSEGALLVFDWGAGTLDLAVLTLADGRPQGIPDLVGGKPGLGGEDIDRHLLQSVNKRLVQLGLAKLERRAPDEIEHVRRKVTEWKLRHAAKPGAIWPLTGLPDVSPEAGLKWTSEEIGERIGDKIKEAVDACAELLERAKAKGVVPTGALLVGGSSQFPALKAALEERFPGMKLLPWDQRISAVALGAAWQAAANFAPPPAVPVVVPPPLPAAPARPPASLIIGDKVIVDVTMCHYDPNLMAPIYELGGHFGLVSETGALLVKPTWDDASEPAEGLVCVKVGKEYGYADCAGEFVVRPQWRNANRFSEGLAAVSLHGDHYFIHSTGQVAFESPLPLPSDFSEGLAAGGAIFGQKGFLDRDGNVAIPPQWEDASDFSEGVSIVTTAKQSGLIDRRGRAVTPLQWIDASRFAEGLVAVKDRKGWGYINREGRLAIPTQWTSAGLFSEGLAAVAYGGKTGYIDKLGKTVIARRWEEGSGFSEGLARVWQGGRDGFIDKTGQAIVPLQWELSLSASNVPWNFLGGFASVRLNGKTGLVNRQAEVVISPEWDCIHWSTTSDTSRHSFIVPNREVNAAGTAATFLRLIRLIPDLSGRSPKATLSALEALRTGRTGQTRALVRYLNGNLKTLWEAELPVEVIKKD
ncbi:MAG TPA: WG repeat-containing protein [Chthoniobacteraceae bacterium]|jgi:actin-like ATPase involved in cell morphogenesis|nr:WG repeat-containing protein [Chthoniobacteraceae bacterium]